MEPDAMMVARELGRLTEAVNGLKSSVEKRDLDHAALEKRVGKIENRNSLIQGGLYVLTAIVGFLGWDRLIKLFH